MSSNYSPKVAIIIPTIFRDDLLMDTIETIIENCDMEETKIIIVDQNKEETYSERKRIFYETACSQFHSEKRIEVIKVPYDSGISYCRNVAVELAKEQNIPYCFITADSIEFTESMKKLPKLLTYMKRYDIIGLDIKDRIGWEGILRLIPNDCFELEFIDKTCKLCSPKKLIIFHCDIVRNFFIGKTEVLYKIKWDNELKCREHESVLGSTPILFKNRHGVNIVPIASLMKAKETKKKISCKENKTNLKNYHVWTDKGWSKIKYIKRHPCVRPIYSILTSNSFVECTEDHSLIIDNKEVNPKDLKVGDYIENIKMPSFENSIDFNLDLAWLFGFFTADGCRCNFKVSDKYTQTTYNFKNTNLKKLEKAQAILNSFGIETKLRKYTKKYKGAYNKKDIYSLEFYGDNKHVFKIYFDKFYLNNEKTIPAFVYKFNKQSRKVFLDGFLDGDGCIVKDREYTFKISQKNQCVINGIIYLSNDFWNCTLNYERRNKTQIYFKLNINKTGKRRIPTNKIKKIEKYNYDGFVYDIETENHHFCGGIGNVNLHNSFFYEAKKQNVKVGFTKYCFGDYKGEKYKRGDNEYAKLRRRNMDMCREILFKKYNLKRWITYKHLERKNQ